MSLLTSLVLLPSVSGAAAYADAVSTRPGSGGAGPGLEGAGEAGGGSVWMEGVCVQVGVSVEVGVELDAVSCLLFDFKDGGAESGKKVE